MKIDVATGTRADWGIMLPLLRTLAARGCGLRILATYMHLFGDMGHTVDEIRADGFDPVEIPLPRDPAEATGAAVAGFSHALRASLPDCLLLLGDRFEMLGAATAALLTGVPVVHIAGGTVSEGAFDDSIRNAISKMATLHLVETELCRHRLLQMGENPSAVVRTGALGVWNALNVGRLDRRALAARIGFDPGEKFIMATYHPETLASLPATRQLSIFLSGLRMALEADPHLRVIITAPNSDTDPAPLIALIHAFAAESPERVCYVRSLGRVGYLSAVALSRGVVGNSSSGIVETPSLGVPTVNVGDRQKGRERGEGVYDVPLMAESVAEGVRRAVSAPVVKRYESPYFGGDVPAVMADSIFAAASGPDRLLYPFPRKRWHDAVDLSWS